MNLQETLAAAHEELATMEAAAKAAQDALAGAQIKANAAQLAVEAAQPHLAMLTRLETYVGHLPAEVAAEFSQVVADAKALLS